MSPYVSPKTADPECNGSPSGDSLRCPRCPCSRLPGFFPAQLATRAAQHHFPCMVSVIRARRCPSSPECRGSDLVEVHAGPFVLHGAILGTPTRSPFLLHDRNLSHSGRSGTNMHPVSCPQVPEIRICDRYRAAGHGVDRACASVATFRDSRPFADCVAWRTVAIASPRAFATHQRKFGRGRKGGWS